MVASGERVRGGDGGGVCRVLDGEELAKRLGSVGLEAVQDMAARERLVIGLE